MGKVMYDFREGMEKEKIVYKDTGVDCRSFMYYVGYLLFTWVYMAGWFALFLYAYIYHESIAFWVYIACWLAFTIFLIVILSWNLRYFHQLKKKKKQKKLLQDKIEANRIRAEREAKKENIILHGAEQPIVIYQTTENAQLINN
jgi:predicted membrane protein